MIADRCYHRLALNETLEALDESIGIDKCLPTSLHGGGIVAVRRLELAASLCRFRGLEVGD